MWGRESCDCYMLWDLRSERCDSGSAVKAPGDSGRWHYSPHASDDPRVILCSLTSYISLLSVDSMLSTARIWSHVTAHSTHSLLCLLTQYPGQTALPSLLFSAPAQLSSLQATWPGCGLPGSLQAREKLTGHNETLRLGPGSRKTRRYSLTCCFVLKLITFELKTFNIWNILISFEILRNAVVESYEIVLREHYGLS